MVGRSCSVVADAAVSHWVGEGVDEVVATWRIAVVSRSAVAHGHRITELANAAVDKPLSFTGKPMARL